MLLKRTKSAGEGQTPAVHYAISVGPGGEVTAWTNSKDHACGIDEATAEKIKARYKDRPNAGKFELVKGDGKQVVEKTEPKEDKAVAAKAFDRIKFLEADLADTEAELKRERDARKESEAELTLLREDNERLKKLSNPPLPPKGNKPPTPPEPPLA